MAYSQLQFAWLTAAENAGATHVEREVIVDTTNWRLVVHDGVTPGGKPQASEAYVQTQIGSLSAGAASNYTQWLTCT